VTQGGRGIEQMQTDYALGLHLLVTLSALFLLIACANIANLLLARGSANIPDKLGGLYQRLEDALPQIPGVLSASRSWYSPLGGNNANERVYIQGKPPDYRWTAPSWDRVGPHYFETIGTRLLRGRVIDEHDTPAARHVAVINETFARRFFPTEDPIGQHFGMEDISHSGDYDIVAIVGDAKYQDPRGPAYATFFLPLLQTSPGEPVRGWVGAIELRVAGKPENIESSVHRTLADVDPNLTVLNIVTFGEQVARNFNQERLIARLAELFGVLALILACVGLYGVTAYARRAADQRDWHPNGTRCRPQECPRPSAAQCATTARHWPGNRHTGRARGRAHSCGRALRCQELRCDDPGLGCDDSRCFRSYSSISSGTSSSQRGSVGRLALRVIHTVMTRVLFTTPKRF